MFTSVRLASVLTRLGAVPAPQLFHQLEDLYGEPTRFYHTDQHVSECISALDQHITLADRPAEVEVAIWFHDAIYDPRRPDNEEQSADLAGDVLSGLAVARNSIARIQAMILATKSHQAHDRDSQVLVDIDLGILGQPPAVFARYDDAIRREYAWVPEVQYRTGRKAVLRGFLDRPWIYATHTFRELYEAQARKNLEWRLKALDV
jgi:predicted metal-dependent HD superfamily phosphohydrolase